MNKRLCKQQFEANAANLTLVLKCIVSISQMKVFCSLAYFQTPP